MQKSLKRRQAGKLGSVRKLQRSRFYGIARNADTVTLEKSAWDVPESMPFGNDIVVPIRANEQIEWKVK